MSEEILSKFSNVTSYLEQLQRGQHSSMKAIKERCNYLHHLDPQQRCQFVRSNKRCDELSELIMYHEFMYCTISNPTFTNPVFLAAAFLMFLWMVFLFLILVVTVDDIFCPALGVISKLMKLSENLAGVTLLAFGNGAPDVLEGLTHGSTILIFNSAMGSAMFVSCLVPGIIATVKPFNIQAFPFIRDVSFMLFSVVWIRVTTLDEEVSIGEAFSYIGIYMLYLIIVIGGYLIQEKLQKYLTIDGTQDVDWDELRRRSMISLEDEDGTTAPQAQHSSEEETSLCGEFWNTLSPIKSDEWKEMICIEKFMTIVKSPLLLILRFFIPVVNQGSNKNGWCKLLNSIQCLFFPSYLVLILQFHDYSFFGVNIFAYTAAGGLILFLLVFFTSKKDKPPPYHFLFAFMGLVGGMATIYSLAEEVVAVLRLFGTLLHMRVQTLGLTVLAWGNSIGDAIANISVARQGFQRMAFAGCFGGPIFNTLTSMGITFLIRHFTGRKRPGLVRSGVMGPVCTTFLMMSLSYTLAYIFLTNFEGRKSFGIFLILIYAEFLLFIFLAETNLIHPLGSDHEFDTDLYYIKDTNIL